MRGVGGGGHNLLTPQSILEDRTLILQNDSFEMQHKKPIYDTEKDKSEIASHDIFAFIFASKTFIFDQVCVLLA